MENEKKKKLTASHSGNETSQSAGGYITIYFHS